jgi:hypothetical protein
MSNHWIVNDQKVMVALFDDATKARHSIDVAQMWLEVPEGVAPGNCKVSGEWPELFLVDGSADKVNPQWSALRKQRNALLAECDWTRMDDCGLSVEVKAEWATYRQELRDLPAETESPEDVVWPTKPE